MRLGRRKVTAWIVIIGLCTVGLLAAVALFGGVINSSQRGADPGSALTLAQPTLAPDSPQVVWLPDDPDTGRGVEPFTRKQIETAYALAWREWAAAYRTGATSGLRAYFGGPGLDAVTEAVTQTMRANHQLSQSDSRHVLQLHFYAPDGSIAAFSDSAASVTRTIRDRSGSILFDEGADEAYDIVMLLEDGHWRIRHMVRQPGP